MKIVNFAVSSIYGAIVLLLVLALKPFIIFIANGIVTSTNKYDIDPYLVIEKNIKRVNFFCWHLKVKDI